MKKYIEIEGTKGFEYEPKEMIRFYVADDEEAEMIYEAHKDVIQDHKAKLVEMNHDANNNLNKPCKAFDIIDGKVKR